MLNEESKKGLARILEISCPKDVEFLQLKLIPGNPLNETIEEATEEILKHVQKPSEILRRQNIKKETIAIYLEENGISVPKELTKGDCIRRCLDKWNVKDANFLVKQRRSEEQSPRYMSPLGNCTNSDVEEVRPDIQLINRKKLKEILESVREKNHFQQLQKQEEDEEEIQVLTQTDVFTEPLSKETVESLYSSSLQSSTNNSGRIHKSASFPAYQIGPEMIRLANKPPVFLSESSVSLPSVSHPERNQSISDSVPLRCSSAPAYQDDRRQSTFSSKDLHSVSSGENLFSQMFIPGPSSTEPFNFSPDSPNKSDLYLAGSMEGGSVFPTPSSHICRTEKTERESPKLTLTETFISSPRSSMRMGNVFRKGFAESEHRPITLSRTFNFHESSYITQPSTSKQSTCAASVSDAGVQTLLLEPPEFPANRSTVSQVNKSHICSPEQEVLLSHDNWPVLTTETQRCKRHHEYAEEECVLSHHRNRNNTCSAEVPDPKRGRWTSLSNTKDCSCGIPNVIRNQPTLSECPYCEKQYFLPFPETFRNGSDAPSKTCTYKKKRPLSLSKNGSLPEKQRRLTVLPKQAKKTSDGSKKPSALVAKAKISKGKYPSSLNAKTLDQHGNRRQLIPSSKQRCYTSSISSERHKLQKESFKKMKRRRDNTWIETKNEEAASSFHMTEPFTSELATSESSIDSLPSNNPKDKTVQAPPGSWSVPLDLLSKSELKLTSPDSAPGSSDENENPPTDSLYPQKPLTRPRRYCCTLT